MAKAERTGTRLDVALLSACVVASLVFTFLDLSRREATAAFLRRTLVAPLVALQGNAERLRGALADRDRIAAQLDSAKIQAWSLRDMEQENARLRRLLGLGRRLDNGFVVADVIHSRVLGSEQTALVPVGSSVGIAPNGLVIAPEGLVGYVTAVDRDQSTVMLWQHPDFRVSAMAEDGSAFGIVRPRLGTEGERTLLEFRGVAYRAQLKPGVQVVSTGIGGVAPRGVPIGRVIRQIESPETWAPTYLVQPMVRASDVTTVMIVLPARSTAGLAGVWTSSSGDSLARSVAAAGDSILRDSAATAARARSDSIAARVADSIRRTMSLPGATPPAPASGARTDSSVKRPTLPAAVPAPPVPRPTRDSVPAAGRAPADTLPKRKAPARPPSVAPTKKPIVRDTSGRR